MEPFPPMEDRRRLTLSNRLSVDDSCNLRELLMDHQEEDDYDDALRRHALVSHKAKTLATVLACEKRNDRSSSSSSSTSSATTTSTATRTLLDIIRNEDDPRCLIIGASNDLSGGTYRIRWKSFKDRLRRASSILSSASEDPSSSSRDAAPVNNNSSSSSSPRLTAPDPRNPDQESITPTAAAAVTFTTAASRRPSAADEPIRISLMALLEQTDRMGGPIEGQTSTLAAAMVGTVEEEEGENGGGGDESLAEEAMSAVEKGTFVCCVCMVRHKGAAFIPCGHTFCRLCSRELWVSRGNCPLCNGFILEILDIF